MAQKYSGKYTIFINLNIELKKVDFPTFPDAFLFLCYIVFSEKLRKRFRFDPYDTKRIESEFWIMEHGKNLIRFDEAIKKAEKLGIANPFMQKESSANKFSIVVSGKVILQEFSNFTEAFLNMCYHAVKMNKTRACENWIYVPNGECRYGKGKTSKGWIIYLDRATMMADEIGIPSPFKGRYKK